MKFAVVTIFLVVLIGSQAAPQDDVLQQWNEFQVKYEKSYKSPVEAQKRYEIFRENLEKITAHNELFTQGLETYEQGVNSFADLTHEEIMELSGGDDSETIPDELLTFINITGPAPDTIDWRDQGVLTEVKDQGKCGSCYAFAVTGAVESQLAIVQNNHAILSEQNIVDCADNYNCQGCIKGNIKGALQFIEFDGITSAEKYPYTAKVGKCKKIGNPKYTIKGYEAIKKNETNVKKMVGTKGPVAIAYTFPDALAYYKTGVFYEQKACTGFRHVSLIVGYGTENNAEYWLVRNSWGKNWGDNGYFKIARNKGNYCGVGTIAFIPKLK